MRLDPQPDADHDMSHDQPDTPDHFDLTAPTAAPTRKHAAVRIVDDRGIESLKAMDLE
jgi:hypothetical protein